MALTPIYTRSPRFISETGTVDQEVRVDLFVWNSPDSIPSNPTTVLSKPIPSTTRTTVQFDISPYIRENLSFTTFTAVTVEGALPVGEYCYATAKTYLDDVLQTTDEFICFDGYGYFADGNNPTVSPILADEGTYYYETSNSDEGAIVIHDDQAVTWTANYAEIGSTAPATIITISNEVSQIPNVHADFRLFGNTVTIYRNSVLQKTLVFEPICEGKYTIIKCDFINRHGAWQRINFFKVSKSKFSAKRKDYNLMPSSVAYSTSANIRQSFNINGNDSITCNTGWVNDGYAEQIKQLMLSEEVRLDDVPVKVKTMSTDLKEGINDQNINYKIDFDYSFSTINYIV
jgi:hypothetical protein